MRPQHLIATLLLFSMTSCTNSPEQEKLKAIDSHSEAVYIHDSWVRDPYIILADDGYYYLTGTMPLEDDERQYSDRYNIGLNEGSIVGNEVRLWRSVDLVNWESLGSPYSLKDTFAAYDEQRVAKKRSGKVLWAPELHQVGGRWALVHCPQIYSTLALSEGSEITNSWSHPSVDIFYQKHDPSLFCDDGVWYLLWGNTSIARINSDFTALETKPVRIDPSDRVIGHEGATMRKIGDKYVHFGTAWSADNKRTGGGSYNLGFNTAEQE
ncbi:MAG: family 43 glycosylhydrolase, partial [Rikenellaceae bacterium]